MVQMAAQNDVAPLSHTSPVPERGDALEGEPAVRNPRTGEAVSISASTSPTFKAGKRLKDAVNVGPGS